jgi:outer membrane putative beta-barrel porin/alpha-amylase
MSTYRFAMGVLAALLACGTGPRAYADQGLAEQFNSLFGPQGLILQTQQFHTAHFTSDSQALLGLLVQQLAPAAADFPAVSTVPGLTYRYNTELQAFERSSGSLGPVYVERPQTIGRGKLDVGFSYLFQHFDQLDGARLDGLFFRLGHADCCTIGAPFDDPAFGRPDGSLSGFERETADVTFEEFDLESHVLSLYATYGITDRWDVNVLVPIMNTSLDVSVRAVLNNAEINPFTGRPTHLFPNGTNVATRHIDDDSTGVGDVLLRTKYHFLSSNGFNLASGLSLRLPSGDEDNFQGLGDVVLTPYLALSQEWSRFDFHFQAGYDINADDTERSRARYAIGLTTQLVERVAFLIDIIGSSNLTTQDISASGVPVIEGSVRAGSRTVTRGLSTDIVDLAVGFKAAFAQSVVGFAAVFLPLNDDGLRSDAVPTAGLEVSF